MRMESGYFEFEWDKGNIGKNLKHDVFDSEAEEAFFDEDKVILKDILHSKQEPRLFSWVEQKIVAYCF